jgi:hypothetical protein
VGKRLAEDFLSRTIMDRCTSVKETAEALAKVYQHCLDINQVIIAFTGRCLTREPFHDYSPVLLRIWECNHKSTIGATMAIAFRLL